MGEPVKMGHFRKYRETYFTVLGTLSVIGVGGVTGWSSWGHIVSVGDSVNEPSAILLPVAIDGMMLGSTMMAAVDRLHGMRTRFFAVLGLWSGAALTLTFNLMSAYERGIPAMMIAVLYAVTFVISVEMVFHPSRTPLAAIKKVVEEVTHSKAPVPVKAPAPAIEKTTPAKAEAPPPGTKGRKPGPQEQSGNRRVHARSRGMAGGDGRPMKPAQPAQESKPAQVIAVPKVPADVDSFAMDEPLSALIGTATAPVEPQV